MKRILLSFWLLSASSGISAPADYPLTINSQASTAPLVTVSRASQRSFALTFKDGATASDISGCVPWMSWSTNANAQTVSTASCSIVSATAGTARATFSASSLNYTPGRYIYEVGITTGSVPQVYRQGVIVIEGSPYSAGGLATAWTTNHPWSLITGTPTTLSGYGITNQVVFEGDTRLSDARTPVGHTQSVATITGLGTAALSNATDFATAAQGALADAALLTNGIRAMLADLNMGSNSIIQCSQIWGVGLPSMNSFFINFDSTATDYLRGDSTGHSFYVHLNNADISHQTTNLLSLTTDIDLQGKKILSLGDPTTTNDAVNKNYVDTHLGDYLMGSSNLSVTGTWNPAVPGRYTLEGTRNGHNLYLSTSEGWGIWYEAGAPDAWVLGTNTVPMMGPVWKIDYTNGVEVPSGEFIRAGFPTSGVATVVVSQVSFLLDEKILVNGIFKGTKAVGTNNFAGSSYLVLTTNTPAAGQAILSDGAGKFYAGSAASSETDPIFTNYFARTSRLDNASIDGMLSLCCYKDANGKAIRINVDGVVTDWPSEFRYGDYTNENRGNKTQMKQWGACYDTTNVYFFMEITNRNFTDYVRYFSSASNQSEIWAGLWLDVDRSTNTQLQNVHGTSAGQWEPGFHDGADILLEWGMNTNIGALGEGFNSWGSNDDATVMGPPVVGGQKAYSGKTCEFSVPLSFIKSTLALFPDNVFFDPTNSPRRWKIGSTVEGYFKTNNVVLESTGRDFGMPPMLISGVANIGVGTTNFQGYLQLYGDDVLPTQSGVVFRASYAVLTNLQWLITNTIGTYTNTSIPGWTGIYNSAGCLIGHTP